MVNMDETRLVLELGFNTTADLIGIKQINIDTNERDHYRTTVILSVDEDVTKLSSLVILKGEHGKSVKNISRKLPCIISINIYIAKLMLCVVIIYLMNGSLKFFTLSKFIRRKIFALDKASNHSSDESRFIKIKKINYILIPSDITPILQLMNISINKVFKDNIRFLFEKDRLLLDNIIPKIKLQTVQTNVLNYIDNIWNKEEPINKKYC